MRRFTLLFFVAAFISAIAAFKIVKNNASCTTNNAAPRKLSVTDMRKTKFVYLEKYADQIKAYTLKNNFNTRYCFMIDMKMASGSKRFFIYDLQNDSVLQSGLVTHGSGRNNLNDSAVFSNEPGSNCTSLGKYKIGKPYYGAFGVAYKLYGLDKTNNNVFNRFVVLHAHPCVPDNEIAPRYICRSWGCPTISPLFLNQLRIYLDKPGKPILLWIFDR
ncbi:MAG: murein L,D-transpeptidase catalytic domain-containing protein [Ferruginibacter sp.]